MGNLKAGGVMWERVLIGVVKLCDERGLTCALRKQRL
jgi:hypothetical protein